MIMCIRTRVAPDVEPALFVYIISIIYINIIYKYINNINVCVRRVVQKKSKKKIKRREESERNGEKFTMRERDNGKRQRNRKTDGFSGPETVNSINRFE